jgi:hypothetical protein
MATRSITVSKPSTNTELGVWTGLLNGDDGEKLQPFDYSDCTIQFDGTFGAGGTIVWQGSNDGTTWFTLTDAQTTAISKTAAAIEQVAEVSLYVRPLVTAGDGTTNLNARFYARRGRS